MKAPHTPTPTEMAAAMCATYSVAYLQEMVQEISKILDQASLTPGDPNTPPRSHRAEYEAAAKRSHEINNLILELHLERGKLFTLTSLDDFQKQRKKIQAIEEALEAKRKT